MKILPEQEEFLRMSIRNSLALNPLISIRRMQEIVKHNTGRTISDKYTARLMSKIRRTAIIQSDRKIMNERLAEVREKYRVLMDRLNRMIFWQINYIKDYDMQEPKMNEKIAAMRLLAQLETNLFKTELYVGTFENRQVAIDEMLRQGLLPTELHEQVVAIFRAWKFRPRA